MTERLPIFPLRTVLFPGRQLRLRVFEPRYRLMLEHHGAADPVFGVVAIRSGSEVGDEPETFAIGTAATRLERRAMPDGGIGLLVRGGSRFVVTAADWDASYLSASVRWIDDLDVSHAPSADQAVKRITQLVGTYLSLMAPGMRMKGESLRFDGDPIALAYAVASNAPLPLERRQRLLEVAQPDLLLGELAAALDHEIALVLRTGGAIALPGDARNRFTAN